MIPGYIKNKFVGRAVTENLNKVFADAFPDKHIDLNTKVEIYTAKGNEVLKLIIFKNGKEFFNVQNVVTPQGCHELNLRKGWETWSKDFMNLAKSTFKTKIQQKSFLQRLFRWPWKK